MNNVPLNQVSWLLSPAEVLTSVHSSSPHPEAPSSLLPATSCQHHDPLWIVPCGQLIGLFYVEVARALGAVPADLEDTNI